MTRQRKVATITVDVLMDDLPPALLGRKVNRNDPDDVKRAGEEVERLHQAQQAADVAQRNATLAIVARVKAAVAQIAPDARVAVSDNWGPHWEGPPPA